MRFLVIRLTALGDVVLVEPVIRALRMRFPGAQIDFLTEARFVSLGASFFSADTLIGYDRHGRDRGLAGLRAVKKRLPAQFYSATIDLQNKFRTRWLAAHIRADRHLVLKKRGRFGGIRALFRKSAPVLRPHTIDLYLSALAPLGIPACTGGEKTWPQAPRPTPWLRPAAPNQWTIGLAPSATQATKRWPKERFSALADALTERLGSVRFVLIGGPEDRALLNSVRVHARRATFMDVDVGSLPVKNLTAVLASLDLLVSTDSGPAHLAQAIGVPSVLLFGPTSPERWGPRAPGHRVVSLGLSCAPCSNFGGAVCPLHTHACMRGLEVEQVFSEVLLALP